MFTFWGLINDDIYNVVHLYLSFISPGKDSQARQSVYQRAKKHFRSAQSQEMLVPGDNTEKALPVGGVAKDHDYANHPSPG